MIVVDEWWRVWEWRGPNRQPVKLGEVDFDERKTAILEPPIVTWRPGPLYKHRIAIHAARLVSGTFHATTVQGKSWTPPQRGNGPKANGRSH